MAYEQDKINTGKNEIAPFAIGVGANVLDPTDWAADSTRPVGFPDGRTPSKKVNTVSRQMSFIAAMLAQFSADFSEKPALDDSDVLQAEQNFIDALRNFSKSVYFVKDDGTANAMKGSPTPSANSYDERMLIIVKKMHSSNTGAMTANFWNHGIVPLTDNTGAALTSGALIGSSYYILNYCGGNFRVLGGVAQYSTISNITIADGDMFDVFADHTVNFRTLRGTADATVNDLDRWPRGEASDDTDKYLTSLEFLDWIKSHLSKKNGFLGIQVITESGVYTKSQGTKKVLVFATGGGGAGGVQISCAGGGGAGATAIALVDLTNVNTVNCTIGAGGIGVKAAPNTLTIGGNGGDTSFGGYAVAGGGPGGGGSVAPGGGSTESYLPGKEGTPGGIATVGNMLINGGCGDSSAGGTSGAGGASFWGGGGAAPSNSDPVNNGYNATQFGGGGGGGQSDGPLPEVEGAYYISSGGIITPYSGPLISGYSGRTGGNGMHGVILVLEFGGV